MDYFHCTSWLHPLMIHISDQINISILSYIDPGTGSLIIQVMIGVIVGGLFSLKVFWRRLSGLLRGFFRRSSHDEKLNK